MADTIQLCWNQNITIANACAKIEIDLGATPESLEKAIAQCRSEETKVQNQMIYSIIYDKSQEYQVVVLSFQIILEARKPTVRTVKQHWLFNPYGPMWQLGKKETSATNYQLP